MEGRTLRERKGISYDEKALEAKRYEDAFDFMDTDEEVKKGSKNRCVLVMISCQIGLRFMPVLAVPYCCGPSVFTLCRKFLTNQNKAAPPTVDRSGCAHQVCPAQR